MRLFPSTALAVVLLLVAPCRPASAQGFSDYDYPVGNGYTVFRANFMDVGITHGTGVIIMGTARNGAGPMLAYAVTPTHIYTRHAGRKARKLFPGDTFEDVDFTKTFYFILDQRRVSARGPMSAAAFATDPDVTGVALNWSEPENPTFAAIGKVLMIGLLVFAGLSVGGVVVAIILLRRAGSRTKAGPLTPV